MKNTYWNGDGKYQGAYDLLQEKIPPMGECTNNRTTNKHLDKMRRAGNCYYDLYNNGLYNRTAEFRVLFGFSPLKIFSHYRSYRNGGCRKEVNFDNPKLWSAVDTVMDAYIEAAAKEQGVDLNTPMKVKPPAPPSIYVLNDH